MKAIKISIVVLLVVAGLLAAAYGVKLMTRPKLKYFKPAEFGPWWALMNTDLLLKLDLFREKWGAPVSVSKAEGAIGRHAGESGSQHNVDMWGDVRAVDIHPHGMTTQADRKRAVSIAQEVGFTGIGLYAEWNTPGLHLDVREPNAAGQVATWAGYFDANGNQRTDAPIERGYA